MLFEILISKKKQQNFWIKKSSSHSVRFPSAFSNKLGLFYWRLKQSSRGPFTLNELSKMRFFSSGLSTLLPRTQTFLDSKLLESVASALRIPQLACELPAKKALLGGNCLSVDDSSTDWIGITRSDSGDGNAILELCFEFKRFAAIELKCSFDWKHVS